MPSVCAWSLPLCESPNAGIGLQARHSFSVDCCGSQVCLCLRWEEPDISCFPYLERRKVCDSERCHMWSSWIALAYMCAHCLFSCVCTRAPAPVCREG